MTRQRGANFNPRSPHGERHIHIGVGDHTAHFNPRSPHGERRFQIKKGFAPGKFQPTLPARGATRAPARQAARAPYFNPRSPHGERRRVQRLHQQRFAFQPTLPARGATPVCILLSGRVLISTHAPRTGSDEIQVENHAGIKHFNPRSPHGERPAEGTNEAAEWHFNPRSPHGERHDGTLLRFAAQ